MTQGSPLPPETILQILADGPTRIEAATSQISAVFLAQPPDPGEWSLLEILAHLKACQDVWGDNRVVRMLREDGPTIRAINPNTWLVRTDYRGRSFANLLGEFASQRTAFLAVLDALPPQGWLRSGSVVGAGRTRVISVHREADALARHERTHVRQLERLCLSL